MDKKIIQRVIVGGVLIKDGKVLILQRHHDEDIYPDMWELPSGKKDFLEPTEISLLREVKEEAGIDVTIIRPISVFDYQIEKEDEIRDSTQINFLVEQINSEEKIILSEEHSDFAWVDQETMNNYNLTDSTKKVITEAFSFIIE